LADKKLSPRCTIFVHPYYYSYRDIYTVIYLVRIRRKEIIKEEV